MFSQSRLTTKEPVLEIRFANEADAQSIANIAIKTYVETYGKSNEKKAKGLYGDDFVNTTIPAWLQDKNILVAIAKINDEMIGYAKLCVQKDGLALLDKLYIEKNHQRQGVGRGLLQFCFQQAQQLGATTGKLLVYGKNTNAIDFYAVNGFIRTGKKEPYHLPNGSLSTYLNDVMTCSNINNILQPPPSGLAKSISPLVA